MDALQESKESFQVEIQTFTRLRKQLACFGLNPAEWMLFAKTKNTYAFAHRKDPAFKINATVRSFRTGLVRVDKISVISV